MKIIAKSAAAVFVFSLASGAAVAGAGIPCDKWEHSKLKDSTKKELTSEYCSVMATSKLNADLKEVSEDFHGKLLAMGNFRKAKEVSQEITEKGDAQVSCIAAAEDAASMLTKKFKAPRPICK